MAVETTRNVLHPCRCGSKSHIIEEAYYHGGLGEYRIVCPICKNNEDGYFLDSIESAIRAWNGGLWRWDDIK